MQPVTFVANCSLTAADSHMYHRLQGSGWTILFAFQTVFFAKAHRLAIVNPLQTDNRQRDRKKHAPMARPLVRPAKMFIACNNKTSKEHYAHQFISDFSS